MFFPAINDFNLICEKKFEGTCCYFRSVRSEILVCFVKSLSFKASSRCLDGGVTPCCAIVILWLDFRQSELSGAMIDRWGACVDIPGDLAVHIKCHGDWRRLALFLTDPFWDTSRRFLHLVMQLIREEERIKMVTYFFLSLIFSCVHRLVFLKDVGSLCQYFCAPSTRAFEPNLHLARSLQTRTSNNLSKDVPIWHLYLMFFVRAGTALPVVFLFVSVPWKTIHQISDLIKGYFGTAQGNYYSWGGEWTCP